MSLDEFGAGGAIEPFELHERGERGGDRAIIVLANLPDHIAKREAKILVEQLGLDAKAIEVERPKCRGAGNVLHVIVEHSEVTEVVTGFGQKGIPAERVASLAAAEALDYLEYTAPVGEHLADQLVIPLALAKRGSVTCTPPSLHTRTNVAVVGRFIDDVELSLGERDGSWSLEASPS